MEASWIVRFGEIMVEFRSRFFAVELSFRGGVRFSLGETAHQSEGLDRFLLRIAESGAYIALIRQT